MGSETGGSSDQRVRFFSLRRVSTDLPPFGVLRAEGPVVERWVPVTGEWVEAPGEHDYLIGNEPGAREITMAEADRLIESGTLAPIRREDLIPGEDR